MSRITCSRRRIKCSHPMCKNDADYRLEGLTFPDGSPLYTCCECMPSLILALIEALGLEDEAL